MKSTLISFLLIFFSLTSFSQDKILFEKKTFIVKKDTMLYRILLPVNYDAAKQYPLIIFLHGSGERGTDNEKQLIHGSKLFVRDSIRKNYPAIVLFPQCSINSYWSNAYRTFNAKDSTTFNFRKEGEPTIAMKLLQKLIKKISKEYPVNKKQFYVTGLSMGGMGTFELVRRNPKMFAAAMPICGGANINTARKLTHTNWWVFHGEKDNVVSFNYSQQMVDAIKAAGGYVKFTTYPNANHNSWDSAFAENDFMHWMFSNKK